jgi:hypothetical protein
MDGGVEGGRIAAGGENADAFHGSNQFGREIRINDGLVKFAADDGTVTEPIFFGHHFGRPTNLIFHFIMQRACQPRENDENRFISHCWPEMRAAFCAA